MQKVITIHGQSFIGTSGSTPKEVQEVFYPELQKLLDDGYKIKESIPMQSTGGNGFSFSITLILEKGKTPQVM